MKKMIALSAASMMLFSMGIASLADIETGIVREEKTQWPHEFGFGSKVTVLRGEEAQDYSAENQDEMTVLPGDEIYIPMYFTTKAGEKVEIGASKEEMTGHVPYTGEIDKSWKLNLVERSKQMVEKSELYKAKSSDKNLVKGGVYVKVETAKTYPSLEEMNFQVSAFVSERYSQNKTASIELKGVFANRKSDKAIDFEWENSVFDKAVWETPEDQDGTATFSFQDDAYFTVKMFGGDKVMLDFDTSFNRDIATRYNEDLYFYNFRGDLDQFSATGTLSIPAAEPMYLYEVINGELRATNAVYNEENEAVELRTRNLGEYVMSPAKFDLAEVPAQEISVEEEVSSRTVTEGYAEKSNNHYASGSQDKSNPDTGAEDFAALAAAAAMLSLTGAAVLSRKK